MGTDVCDNETRALFKKQRKLEFLNTGLGMLMLTLLLWGSFQLFEQGKSHEHYKAKLDSHIMEYADLSTKIPDGFFSKARYGVADAKADREYNQLKRDALDQRLHKLETLSATHISESTLYIQMIKDTAVNVKDLQRVVWKLVPDEPSR